MIQQCRNCKSEDLSWFVAKKNTSGVVDGRLCMHDIKVIFVLGCNECSETLKIVDADIVAENLPIGIL